MRRTEVLLEVSTMNIMRFSNFSDPGRRLSVFASLVIAVTFAGFTPTAATSDSAQTPTGWEAPPADGSRIKEPRPLQKADAAREASELSWRDTIIVTGVRVIFRQTIDLVDLDYVRDRLVEKLQKKNKKSYEKTMNRIFDDLDYLKVKRPLGLTRTSTKRQTIKTIRHTEPQKVVAMVESIPDTRLASWINKEVSDKGLESITEIREYIYERVEKFVAEYTG